MKNERFMIFLSWNVDKFLKENDVQISQIHKLKKGKKELVEARLKDYSQGIANETLAWLHENCEILGIDK